MMDYYDAVQAKHARTLICDDAGREGIIISIPISGAGLAALQRQLSALSD